MKKPAVYCSRSAGSLLFQVTTVISLLSRDASWCTAVPELYGGVTGFFVAAYRSYSKTADFPLLRASGPQRVPEGNYS